MGRIRLYNKRAGLFLEYAAILGLVGIVLFAMNTYFKRGIQARTKDMTDYFISGGEEKQIEEVDPESKSKSTVESESSMDVDKALAQGGRTSQQIDTKEERDVESLVVSTARDSRSPDTFAFISSDAGDVVVPVRPDENQFNDAQLKEMEAIALAQKQQAEADLAACGDNQQCAQEAQDRLDAANSMLTMINDLRGQFSAEPTTLADEGNLPNPEEEINLTILQSARESLASLEKAKADKISAAEDKESLASDKEKEADELRRRVRESTCGFGGTGCLSPQEKFRLLEQARKLDIEARQLRKDSTILRREASFLDPLIEAERTRVTQLEAG